MNKEKQEWIEEWVSHYKKTKEFDGVEELAKSDWLLYAEDEIKGVFYETYDPVIEREKLTKEEIYQMREEFIDVFWDTAKPDFMDRFYYGNPELENE